jgi:hypothetical protein
LEQTGFILQAQAMDAAVIMRNAQRRTDFANASAVAGLASEQGALEAYQWPALVRIKPWSGFVGVAVAKQPEPRGCTGHAIDLRA